MPALALVGLPGPRWLPPLPVPLFLLWPFLVICLGSAWILGKSRPVEAAKLRTVLEAFRQLRGLAIEVETTEQKPVRIRIV